MRYTVEWRSSPHHRTGRREVPNWHAFVADANRASMIENRKYLKKLGHEVRVLLGDIEIEVEDDDK